MSTTTTGPPPAEAPARAPMDPRIRRRRQEVTREEGRRRLRIVLTSASGLALVAAGWGVTRSPVLDVDRIRVVGAERTPADAVVAGSGLRAGQAMVDVREPTVARRVEALPWVATARVSRRWPATVVVSVAEREPAVVVPAPGGGWMLADAEGRLLERVGERPAGLVTLDGLEPPGAPGASLGADAAGALAVVDDLPRELRERVAGVTRLPDGALELALVPEGTVRFGPPEQRAAKLAALLTLVRRVDLRRVAVVDVRVPDAPVVTRR